MHMHEWDKIPIEQMNALTSRQVLHCERVTIARIGLRAGAVVARHSHPNEQITMLQHGRLRFLFDDREIIVSAGQTLQIPGGVPHRVEALQDSVAVDLFSPIREDWIRGDDAYLRG